MNIAVICAMRDELDAILHTLDQKIIREESVLHNSVYVADYNGNNLYLCLSGIGKVNSAIMTQKIIDTYQINYVLNIGVAGALSDELTFGDIVIANDLVEHDVDATAFGLAKGQIPRMDIFSFAADAKIVKLLVDNWQKPQKLHVGRIVSGDQFVSEAMIADGLAVEFYAKACEMEGAAIAHTCYLNNIPFIIIRSMSDKAGREDADATDSYQRLLAMAATAAAQVFPYAIDIVTHNA